MGTYLIEGEKEYEKRLKHYCKSEEILIPDLKKGGKISEMYLKKRGNLILSKLDNSDYLILLDDKGKIFLTEFAALIQRKMISSVKTLVFVVGGALDSAMRFTEGQMRHLVYQK